MRKVFEKSRILAKNRKREAPKTQGKHENRTTRNASAANLLVGLQNRSKTPGYPSETRNAAEQREFRVLLCEKLVLAAWFAGYVVAC